MSSVQREITTGFSGAQVTTAQDLASRITGSLTDAKNLASKLGLVLEIVGLLLILLMAVRPQGLLGNRREMLLER